MGCFEKETVSQIHSKAHTANGTLQEYTQRFTDLVIHAMDADPTTVTCQVTVILFIRHLFNKKEVGGTKNIQT